MANDNSNPDSTVGQPTRRETMGAILPAALLPGRILGCPLQTESTMELNWRSGTDLPADSEGSRFDVFIEYEDSSDETPVRTWYHDGDQWHHWMGDGSETKPTPTKHVETLATDQLQTNARGPTVVVHVDGSSIVADGPEGELAAGQVDNRADVTRVLQRAIDHGGQVRIKGNGTTYTLDTVGRDTGDEPYCLAMQSGTDLVIEHGATLYYPADTSVSPHDIASPVLCSGVDSWRIRGGGTIDAGVSEGDQTSQRRSTMCIKVGVRNQGGKTGCNRWQVRNLTMTGAFRHGIEATDGSTVGRIHDCLFDDASGDDDISISGSEGAPSENIYASDCYSVNANRLGDWATDTLEIEDGASQCGFIDCHVIDPAGGGIQLGKVHYNADYDSCDQVFARGCSVISPGKTGLKIGAFNASNDTIKYHDCDVVDPSQAGLAINAGPGKLTDITVSDCTILGAGGRGVFVQGGTIDDLTIDHNTIKGSRQAHVEFRKNKPETAMDISGVRIHENELTDGENNAIYFHNTPSEYSGAGTIKGNEMLENNFPNIQQNEVEIRQHFVTMDNRSDDATHAMPVAPTDPWVGLEVVAGPVWDPDDDGNGEKVIYDSATWQEVADLPNLT